MSRQRTPEISEGCKEKLEDIEERLLWAIKVANGNELEKYLMPYILSFIGLSFRFASENMDDDCKKLMSKYEDEILHLNMMTVSDQKEALANIAGGIKARISGGAIP